MLPPNDHLDKPTRKLLAASAKVRIRHIQKDRFIPTRAIQSVLELVDSFVTRPVSIRPRCLALVGEAGSGKSTLMEEIERRYRQSGESGSTLVAYCTLDPHPDVRVSQRTLLTALGVPRAVSLFQPRVNGDDLIRRALHELGTRLVIFDEALHLSNLDRSARALVWDWIKWVSTANRVSVVCAGIPGFEQTILQEPQLQTRFQIIRLPRWTPGPAFAQFLTAYERSLPLQRPSALHTQAMQEALLRESALGQGAVGITHGIKQVIESAAIAAIQTGAERVTLSLLPAWRDDLESLVSVKVRRRQPRRARA
jgi:hypothetical protein